eukprot:GAHX01002648.1.p2 GENE.GAHX01002648.1~~GAHX01002648.1.p2  ORF type:complete len:58 (+),score=5.56 GAHX01002648.1:654-827(+)
MECYGEHLPFLDSTKTTSSISPFQMQRLYQHQISTFPMVAFNGIILNKGKVTEIAHI